MPDQAIGRYVGEGYIQHNPNVANKKWALIDCLRHMARDYPGKRVEFKRTFAEGDLVVLHCHECLAGQ